MIDRIPVIGVGDMIEAIDGRSLVGARHFEVAKLLKELPKGRPFALRLTEPRKAFGEPLLGALGALGVLGAPPRRAGGALPRGLGLRGRPGGGARGRKAPGGGVLRVGTGPS